MGGVMRYHPLPSHFVTPAQAGVHHRISKFQRRVMDSRLRGNDEVGDEEREL
jgi:hypothetical protein